MTFSNIRAVVSYIKGRVALPLFIIIAIFSSCGRVGTDPQWREVTYTLMSYNVGSFSKYADELGHHSYQEVADIIEREHPQVIGLQETDYEGKRSDYDKQVDTLAHILGPDWQSRFIYAGYEWYGNGIIWNDEMLHLLQEHERMELEKISGNETRSMGAVEFDDFVFLVTHLDNKSLKDKLAAVEKITSWVDEQFSHSGKPVFLVGDMNARPTTETIEKLQENWIQLTPDAYTYPTDNPAKCLDYIFLFKDADAPRVICMDSGVVTPERNPAVTKASDHSPVYVTVSWQIPLSR